MRTLYAEISDPVIHNIRVGKIHELYVEECGNPSGIPVVFLHGGPGSGCQPYHRQFFDPDKYRIILFDQRGAGRSRPHGCLEENTTHDLISDMEVIRRKLHIDRWVLFGGSWGVTLALLYAQTHPDRVLAMILRGAFLASQRDLEWFFSDKAGRIFPDEWERFTGILNIDTNHYENILHEYHRMITSDHHAERLNAANAWSRWTGKIVTWTLPQDEDEKDEDRDPEQLIRETGLELHYAINHYFLEPDQLIRNIGRLPKVPVKLIHGRRDITCPVESSWRLYKTIPHATLTILHEAGHLAGEPTMIDALVTATDELKTQFA